MRRRQRQILLVCLFSILLFLICEGSNAQICVRQNHTVTVPIHVRVVFAGTTPLFLRENDTPASRQAFQQALSRTLNYPALKFDASHTSPLYGARLENACSVLQHNYTYSVSFADTHTLARLDTSLKSIQEHTNGMFVDSTDVADAFWHELSTDAAFRPAMKFGEYNLLVYNAATLAPQYGFRAEPGGKVGTTGIASDHRFAFIDVGARPFLFEAGGLTTGEELMSVSRTLAQYARKLREVAEGIFTPRPSDRMRRFPRETRLAFRLLRVDVSAVIGRKTGVGGDSTGNRPIGSTFDAKLFESVLGSVFTTGVVNDKKLSVEAETVDMSKDAVTAMGVMRAFSMRGLQMVLDSKRLLQDIVTNDRAGYFVDSSFVAHVPLYLFSIADDSRVTHFESGETIRAQVVGKQAVFMVENRLRDKMDEHITVTAEAAKEVLELLCGLRQWSLSLMNVTTGKVPLILRDVARRNVVAQELDWSESTTARKSEELLNFEGLDSRLIPHEQGSVIAESQKSVKDGLRKLHEAWDAAGASLSAEGVQGPTLTLMDRSKLLADKLHEEVCNQPLPEEILLKAEAEMEGAVEDALDEKDESSLSFLVWVCVPAVAGCLFGTFLHRRSRRRTRPSPALFDDLSVSSAVRGIDVSATTQWFSTLTSSDKSKLH